MRSPDDVKDKNIRLEGFQYRARVEYYNGKVIDCGLFETLPQAQKELLKYPRDVWDGYDKDDYRYKEPEFYVRKTPRHSKALRPRQRSLPLFGRTLVGSI